MTRLALFHSWSDRSKMIAGFAIKLLVVIALYAAAILIPRPQSAAAKGQGVCAEAKLDAVCQCMQKALNNQTLDAQKAGVK